MGGSGGAPGEGARVRLRQSAGSSLHGRGSPRPRAGTAAVTDVVTAPHAPATPSALATPRPATSWKHGRQTLPANRRRRQEERRLRHGAGAAASPGALRRKRGRAGRRRGPPPPRAPAPFPDRAASSLRRARARQPGARSLGPPLKRPLRAAGLPVPVPARLSPRARAPARPQAPRGSRHVTAPSRGGSGGGASFGGGGGSGSGSSCAASVEREACGCEEKGAPDWNG